MVLKKKRSAKKGSSAKRTPKQQIPEDLPKLTETEQDLLWHMEHGYIGWKPIRSAVIPCCAV
jgi:hypothetical protein